MADINHSHLEPVEGDGVNYSGIVWFIVILVATVLVCQVLVWGLFEFSEWRVVRSEPARAPLAAEPAKPAIDGGALQPGVEAAPSPLLLVDEPAVLRQYRHAQDETLSSYGWIDEGAQVVRLPIDRAKDLVLERGLPVRPAETPAQQ